MTPEQKEAFRREVLEEVAEWYASTGWFLDEDDVPAAIRALAASQPAPAADAGQAVAWRPIETAPKDGTPIIGAKKSESVRAFDHFPYPLRVSWNGDVWLADDGNVYEPQPSHWMPTSATQPAPLDAERVREDERLRFEGDLDKWMKMLGAGITGYQPEAYAVMDDACRELVKLRAILRQKEEG